LRGKGGGKKNKSLIVKFFLDFGNGFRKKKREEKGRPQKSRGQSYSPFFFAYSPQEEGKRGGGRTPSLRAPGGGKKKKRVGKRLQLKALAPQKKKGGGGGREGPLWAAGGKKKKKKGESLRLPRP